MFNKNGDNANRDNRDGNPPQTPRPPAPSARTAPAVEPSVINKGLKVMGNMESDGDIVVAGAVEGDITSRGLTVGENATVKGTVTTETVSILGRVEGEIRTRSIRVASSGSMSGNIHYETMAVEEGAEIDGHVSKTAPGAERDNVSTLKAVDRGSADASASSPPARAKS